MTAANGPGLLPSHMEESEYDSLFVNDQVWLPAIRAICQRHGISPSELHRAELGTHIVFRAENHIVKLFCRLWPRDYAVEVACLSSLTGLPIPELVATGELEGWPYLIMTVLGGTPTGKIWQSIDFAEKAAIMGELGEFIRQLHSQPLIDELPFDWDTFLRERVNDLPTHHRLVEEKLSWVQAFVDPIAQNDIRPVVLNGDLTHDHVLVEHTGGYWRFSGIIDFGDAMIGHPYYDFTAPLLDHAFGEPAVAEALLDGYGESLSDDLIRELSRFLFVHRFWGFAELSAKATFTSPEQLLDKFWGRSSA